MRQNAKDEDEDTQPPPNAIALLKAKTSLDQRLYEFAQRLADEQHRSVVWAEEDSDDTCAAAEAAGEAAAMLRGTPIPLPLDANAGSTFTWDGDAYRVYEITVPAPHRPVTLNLKGKAVIGSAPFTVNILISHLTSRPNFAERAFRYVFESRPPHKRTAQFRLGADKLRQCCIEAASKDGEPTNTSAALCAESRPLTLWIALKCRSVAVASLTVSAVVKYAD